MSRKSDNYVIKVTDEVLDASVKIKLSAKQVRSLFPKSGDSVEHPLGKLYDMVPKGAAESVSDVMVSKEFYNNLEYMVEKFALKQKPALTPECQALQTAVAMTMLDLAPVDIDAPSIENNTIYILPAEERHKIMRGNKSEQ